MVAKRNRGNVDGAIALVATIVLQLALGLALLQLRPQASTAVTDDDAIRVEFVPRRKAVSGKTDTSSERPVHGVTTSRPTPSSSEGERANSDATSVPTQGVTTSTAPSLDLHVIDPVSPQRFEQREAFARRPVLDPRRTRFEHVWAPAGNVLEQARFRSRVAGVALGLFGGPPRKCTEVERRLHKPDCLALQGEALDEELARNEADR